ncbi:histidine kinase [Geotalea uraniireducens]|uniref:histidine kinase n=1 Tax=Geotalea uraniireducens TaxID=351604 RepID=A0ABN6VNL2_9BACT|nr:sensor histidine kinase [Geotalea uraniireducens]BDV41828.1 histidine kinase [Geotalea uraniireducens]
MRTISLKTKLVLIVLVLFFVLAPATAYFAIEYSKSCFNDAIQRQQMIMVERIADELDHRIEATVAALASSAKAVTPEIVADPRRAEQFLYDRIGLEAIFDSGVFIYTTAGRLLAETAHRPSRVGFDFSFREHVRKTISTGKPFISAPYIPNPQHVHPVIMFTMPVFAGNGRLIAVLAGSIDLMQRNFLGELADAKIGKKGYFCLYTHGRTILMYPDRNLIFTKESEPQVERYVMDADAGREVAGEITGRHGAGALAAFKRLDTVDWILSANYPLTEAYEPARRLVRLAWWIVGCGGVIAAVVMWLVMQHLISPLLSMTAQIKQIGSGGAGSMTVKVDSNDEIRETAEAFNLLMEELRCREQQAITLQKEAMQAQHLVALGELAAGVAHEINNPINGIINCAQILADDCRRAGGEPEVAQRIMREGERIAVIVRNLLSFARTDGGEKLPVRLIDVLADTLALFTAQLAREGITLTVAVPAGLPVVNAYPHQLQQVFLNILSNARYALLRKCPAPAEGRRLEIRGEYRAGEMVRLLFVDNGTGIPAGVVEQVMVPFFTTKPPGQGTGLGLSISHSIVTEHGGRLRIESREGEFTIVTVELPAARQES